MPNIKSTEKRLRQDVKRTARNKAEKSGGVRERAKLVAAIERKDKEEVSTVFKSYCSKLDKAVKHGILAKNTANRRKSRMSKKVAAV